MGEVLKKRQCVFKPFAGSAAYKTADRLSVPIHPIYLETALFLSLFTNSLLNIMGNLLYIIAVILIIIWALGYFGVMGAGMQGNNLIHILLVIAIIAILLRVIRGGRVV